MSVEQTPEQAPEVVAEAEPVVQAAPVVETRRGMWSDGSGDTSGYGGIVRSVEMPSGVQPPYGSWYDAALARLAELVPDPCTRVVLDRGELTIYVAADKLLDVLRTLRDDAALRFECCASVSGVHYPNVEGEEFHVVYHMQSMTHNRRLRVETTCADADPHVPSVVGIYPAADWHERETWDMFGIIFDGHPHLTRILLPDDWDGHPQRKDYPLGGIPVEFNGARVPPADQRRQYR